MLRQFLCGLVALALIAGVGLAAEKAKKGKAVSGKFESFADGTLKIKVGKKDEAKVQEFKVPDDVKVVTYANDEKKESSSKDAFKDLKSGTNVSLTLGDDDKITAVTVGNAPKQTAGTFASFKDGTLTLKVKGKNGEEAKEFKVADDTKAVTLVGKDKKEGTAKDALKEIAEGTPVTVTLGGKNKVIGVEVGSTKKDK
ncbi:MAG TPA: hypothetical protein VKA46_15270 [Gemmataceae bacterium]|nr:hypothetical protein [Gemmataceae bacterium]